MWGVLDPPVSEFSLSLYRHPSIYILFTCFFTSCNYKIFNCRFTSCKTTISVRSSSSWFHFIYPFVWIIFLTGPWWVSNFDLHKIPCSSYFSVTSFIRQKLNSFYHKLTSEKEDEENLKGGWYYSSWNKIDLPVEFVDWTVGRIYQNPVVITQGKCVGDKYKSRSDDHITVHVHVLIRVVRRLVRINFLFKNNK